MNNVSETAPTLVRTFQLDRLKIKIYPTREDAGHAAALDAAAEMRRLQSVADTVAVIFATGASQLAMLRSLVHLQDVPWRQIVGFHMDEYVGISIEHPASFRNYMAKELTLCVPLVNFFPVDGSATDVNATVRDYGDKLRKMQPGLCLLGIGENGHLAFNDPGVADFSDPEDVKVVALDEQCKQQQVAEGWFPSLGDVPSEAITLTIPALLRTPKLIVSVPGARKAEIVKRTLFEPISELCPATALRNHPDATVYLDSDSASLLSA